MLDREHIVYQILDKDNWEVIDQIDGFLWVFDRMPKRMQLIIDLKMTGNTNHEISALMNIGIKEVQKRLREAKNRIINILY